MLSVNYKPDPESRKLWGWVKVCLWPDLKTRLVCIRRYFFTNPSGQELVWLGSIPGKFETGTAGQGTSTRELWGCRWVSANVLPGVTKQRWQGCPSKWLHIRLTRGALKKKNPGVQPQLRPIRLELMGVGTRHWGALTSSPADFNMQPGLGTTELQVVLKTAL